MYKCILHYYSRHLDIPQRCQRMSVLVKLNSTFNRKRKTQPNSQPPNAKRRGYGTVGARGSGSTSHVLAAPPTLALTRQRHFPAHPNATSQPTLTPSLAASQAAATLPPNTELAQCALALEAVDTIESIEPDGLAFSSAYSFQSLHSISTWSMSSS